jgi:hypothetical protein
MSSNSNSNSNSNNQNKRKYNFPNSNLVPTHSSITNVSDVGMAQAAAPNTAQGKAEQYAEDQLDTDFSQDSLSKEPVNKKNKFEQSKNFNAISATNIGTLEGKAPVPAYERQPKTESTVKFNELVTELFIDPEGLSLRTPPRERTNQETEAKLEELATDVAGCLVRDVTKKADLVNIRSILDTMIKKNPNNLNRSLRVAKTTGADICLVQFTQPNIAFLNSYYYIYEPDKGVKMSYLDYAVTLAIEQFTQNYESSILRQMKSSLINLYTSIMNYLTGDLKGGNKRSRKSKKTSKKSKKRKRSKRRTSKRRTLRKNLLVETLS